MATAISSGKVFIRLVAASAIILPAVTHGAKRLTIDPIAIAEAIPLVTRALEIDARARAREAKHAAELAKRGIAEIPPSKADVRYTINTGGIG